MSSLTSNILKAVFSTYLASHYKNPVSCRSNHKTGLSFLKLTLYLRAARTQALLHTHNEGDEHQTANVRGKTSWSWQPTSCSLLEEHNYFAELRGQLEREGEGMRVALLYYSVDPIKKIVFFIIYTVKYRIDTIVCGGGGVTHFNHIWYYNY